MKKAVAYILITVLLMLAENLFAAPQSTHLETGVGFSVATVSGLLAHADPALAKYYLFGTTQIKGNIGELLANTMLKSFLVETGNWKSFSPRLGPQGLDHVFLKIDKRTGMPKGLIVGETKWKTSQLSNTQDGRQFSSEWLIKRLRALGTRHLEVANTTLMEKLPIIKPDRQLSVCLKNGKMVYFWQESSKHPWKFSGSKTELAEAQHLSAYYGKYLKAAADGKVSYRPRLFRLVPQGNNIVLTIRDATGLTIGTSEKKLQIIDKFIFQDAMIKPRNFKIPVLNEAGKEISN